MRGTCGRVNHCFHCSLFILPGGLLEYGGVFMNWGLFVGANPVVSASNMNTAAIADDQVVDFFFVTLLPQSVQELLSFNQSQEDSACLFRSTDFVHFPSFSNCEMSGSMASASSMSTKRYDIIEDVANEMPFGVAELDNFLKRSLDTVQDVLQWIRTI